MSAGGFLALAQERERVRTGWTTRIAPRWALDAHAVVRACELMGVSERVQVGPVEAGGAYGSTNGRYVWDERAGTHRISLRRMLSREIASATLWHELAHAMQCERAGSWEAFDAAYMAAMRGRGHAAYLANPFEREAREWEARHEWLLLRTA